MKHAVRVAALCVLALGLSPAAWAQWSSDPAQNLDLSNIPGADQVQPKLLSLPDNTWYVSWFNSNPNDPPPRGYDVYYQYLSANGVEQLPHDGVQVAKLTISSTEDYGAAVDSSGNILLAFLDDRHNSNPQVTVTKLTPCRAHHLGAERSRTHQRSRLAPRSQGHGDQRRLHRGRLDQTAALSSCKS